MAEVNSSRFLVKLDLTYWAALDGLGKRSKPLVKYNPLEGVEGVVFDKFRVWRK